MNKKTSGYLDVTPDIPVVSIVGRPDCGKTTLLEKLIPELKKLGYRVGTIKHHVHEFEMDKPGKDTWKHKQAGAAAVALSSPSGLGVIRDVDHDTPVEELVRRYLFDLDVVLTEGYKQENLPKIEVIRSVVHSEPLARDHTWVAQVGDTKAYDDLPHFRPDGVAELAAFIAETFIESHHKPETVLMADGKMVSLNRFVEGFLRKSIIGMTSALKDCDTAREITITIRND